jgi:hypothetical protein
MIADSDSKIAWHRVQLKKNSESLKAAEVARFRVGEVAGLTSRPRQEEISRLKRKIAESLRCIAVHERQIRRPVTTDLGSLSQVRWGSWNTHRGQ